MAYLKGELQDDLGNVLYPNTSYDVVQGAPQVKNNLTETVAGNALDAVQGKILSDKAITAQGGVWANVDLNTLKTNGIYYVSNPEGHTNAPNSLCKYIIVTVYSAHSNYIVQEITDINGKYKYFRSMASGSWSDWKEQVVGDMVNPTLLASGVFSTGNTITLSQALTNFSRVVITYHDGGAECVQHVAWAYPGVFVVGQTFKGVTTQGNYELNLASATTLSVINAGSKYFRKVYGYKI